MTSDDAKAGPAGSARQALEAVVEGIDVPLQPGLYIVATPIGNLADITLRALNVLQRVDIVACEDTRHSRKLFSHYSIQARLQAYHDHSSDQVRERILADIAQGRSVALISDAGTPLISDPGYKLVEQARSQGLYVTALPGACSPIVGLTLSGLPTDRFFFEGFLPSKQGQRFKRLEALQDVRATLIFFEAGKRVEAALADMLTVFGERPVAVVRELTKRFETVLNGDIGAVKDQFSHAEQRGEFVIVVGPPGDVEFSDDDIRRMLVEALKDKSLRDCSRDIAQMTGLNKSRIYAIGVQMKEEAGE